MQADIDAHGDNQQAGQGWRAARHHAPPGPAVGGVLRAGGSGETNRDQGQRSADTEAEHQYCTQRKTPKTFSLRAFCFSAPSPDSSICPVSVKQTAQLRVGTVPLSALLSGHRANEVTNRQDADPIHFVSAVSDFPRAHPGARTRQSPRSEGFVVLAAARIALAAE